MPRECGGAVGYSELKNGDHYYYQYCDHCTCNVKRCFSCNEDKTLSEFERTTTGHLLRITALMETCYKCKQCIKEGK